MMAGQNIKTNYKTPYDKDKQEDALARQAEERALRREARDKQTGKKTYTKGEEKALAKYDDAKLKPKQNPPKAPVPSKTEKAKNWLQERGRAIAHETRDIRPRGSVHGAMGMGLPANPDLFGVSGFGGMHKMMGADPFQEMFPRQAPPPRPRPAARKKKRKSASRRAPAQQGGMPGMMGGIPSHMKWMFGQ
jgi:hypothetical protein